MHDRSVLSPNNIYPSALCVLSMSTTQLVISELFVLGGVQSLDDVYKVKNYMAVSGLLDAEYQTILNDSDSSLVVLAIGQLIL